MWVSLPPTQAVVLRRVHLLAKLVTALQAHCCHLYKIDVTLGAHKDNVKNKTKKQNKGVSQYPGTVLTGDDCVEMYNWRNTTPQPGKKNTRCNGKQKKKQWQKHTCKANNSSGGKGGGGSVRTEKHCATQFHVQRIEVTSKKESTWTVQLSTAPWHSTFPKQDAMVTYLSPVG